jgi:uncharacterized protein
MQGRRSIDILCHISMNPMGLIIRSSAIHAAGCYTTTPIQSGARVVEYTGPRISKEAADEKYQNSPTTYLFGLGKGEIVIDGHGTAMFINHSCDPNCETDEVRGRVWIKAIRNIAANEELTYDYNLYDGDESDANCNCGSVRCRRTMYSHDEIKRRKRAAKAANGAKAKKKRSPSAVPEKRSGEKKSGSRTKFGEKV